MTMTRLERLRSTVNVEGGLIVFDVLVVLALS
jgi:hypothetical protein